MAEVCREGHVLSPPAVTTTNANLAVTVDPDGEKKPKGKVKVVNPVSADQSLMRWRDADHYVQTRRAIWGDPEKTQIQMLEEHPRYQAALKNNQHDIMQEEADCLSWRRDPENPLNVDDGQGCCRKVQVGAIGSNLAARQLGLSDAEYLKYWSCWDGITQVAFVANPQPFDPANMKSPSWPDRVRMSPVPTNTRPLTAPLDSQK
jgi:hypothetical protein